ncbi:WD repeat-containing protein 55 homolog [Anthonomus grandis grandis]|uniref:WD repeat-containing protein 55 homolog n=1 Tax=Anthonomus grandis grandis TaxID=2921223 RepID=UPI002165D478|nr:WD repeat-containing protein 55 homolog [Anthonomus grandis grandis]
MCKKKNQSLSELYTMDTDSDSDISSDSEGDSDVSMSSDSEPENATATETLNTTKDETEDNSEESEDEVIKAIKRECEKKNDHPPTITCEDFITDICFHPVHDILAVANIIGDVLLYKYSLEGNSVLNTLELHSKTCRDIEFSHDGKILFSVSKDKAIMLSDVDTGKLVRFYEKAHDDSLNCLTVIDEHCFATGDDDGTIKLWDQRQNGDKPIYKTKKNEDYITDMITNESHKYLVCSSGDGSLTTIDLEKRSVFMQSEEYDDELTCLGLFRSESKVLAGSSKGVQYLFNWGEFGLHSDAFPGPKESINALIPITENIVVTGQEDGNLRATHLFPHRHLGIVGQHELSVENIDICNNGNFIASSGHLNEIKFWNVQYFEDFEKVSHKHSKHERKRELANNLPSSKVRNTSDFFSDLA